MKTARLSLGKRYGYVWVTFAFFVLSVIGHWLFGWYAYVQEQSEHVQPIEIRQFFIEMMRDTLENWQSEFLQLIWQVAGLAFLLYVGSPQSKEGDDRKEEKLDHILEKLDPAEGKNIIKRLDMKYPRA